jgi:hypothetical protein
MAKGPKFRKDGHPDGRGHSEGSKGSRFGEDDGRRRPGRPKGALSLKTIYLNAAAMPIYVTINNKRRRITTADAIVLKQREKALGGGERASERFIEKLEQYSPIEVQPDRTGELLAEDQAILASAAARGLLGDGEPPTTGEGEGP